MKTLQAMGLERRRIGQPLTQVGSPPIQAEGPTEKVDDDE